MFSSQREAEILALEKELYVAHKRGYIFRFTHITELAPYGDYSKAVGVEIMFSDNVSTEQIAKIKAYIETRYKFYVDDKTYMNPLEPTKIITVRY
jgi:hypothetical protein